MDAKTLTKKAIRKALLSPGNSISGAVALAASAALWNPLPLILWGLGSSGWVLMASTGKKLHQQILEEERREEEARVDAAREGLKQKVEAALEEQPIVNWIRRGMLPDYMQVYRRLVEIRDRVALVLRERNERDMSVLQQLNYMLTAYLHFVQERTIYLHIISNIRPAAASADAQASSSRSSGKSAPPPPPAGFAANRWERVTKVRSGAPNKTVSEPPVSSGPVATLPSIDSRLAEIDEKVARLRELATKEPATARTRQWHMGILEKQRELLVECQKKDQTVVAQLGAFLDVFEVILGRVTASQFSATEIAGYMSSVVEQIEETERFVESLKPAMDELIGGMDPALTRWSATTSS